jgi:hypothetical protein
MGPSWAGGGGPLWCDGPVGPEGALGPGGGVGDDDGDAGGDVMAVCGCVAGVGPGGRVWEAIHVIRPRRRVFRRNKMRRDEPSMGGMKDDR